jgi:HD-GYP domain-containing protein (c-di-GMP phosphodiesterase class II)
VRGPELENLRNAAFLHDIGHMTLAGEAISRPARILAVAETFEALTAGRRCERITPAAALDKLKLGSGTEFDPRVIEALARTVAEGGLEPALPALALPAVSAPEVPAPA